LRLDKPAREIRREAVRTAVSPHGGTSTRITHPERIVDPSTGITKADLVHYYESVARLLLPHLQDRPVSLVRAPDGIAGQMFFQKHAERGLPALTEHPAEKWPGHAPVLSVDSVEAVVAAAQMNVIEFHTWNSTVSRILFPDRVIFDLDPGEGVGWEQLQEAALLVQVLLGELGLTAWLKTSGGKGLHVVVPLAPKRTYEVVKRFSQSLVRHLAATIPQRFVAVSGATNRKGRIFVDYLRNGVAQTTATAFSARARPGMGVSMPVSWDQLMTLKSGAQWSVRDAREYLSFQTADPWSDYWSSRQSLTEPIKRLAGSSRT
jgi:bifunctional non-homologous end joining protein LigD